MQAPINEVVVPFSHEVLIEMYQKLYLSKGLDKTLDLFIVENTPLLSKNPPYSSSIFPDRTRHIVTVLSYLVGYYLDQWFDEAIIGFQYILSTKSKPSAIFNFSQFLVDSIHQHFSISSIEEVF